MTLEEFDKWSEAWDNRPRYVIHGKPASEKYKNIALGCGGHDDDSGSPLIYLYWEKEYAERVLKDSSFPADEFEIRLVTKDELYGKYRKANHI